MMLTCFYAGNGATGYTDLNGLDPVATAVQATALSYDNNGLLYWVDSGAEAIRFVDSDGLVDYLTVASGSPDCAGYSAGTDIYNACINAFDLAFTNNNELLLAVQGFVYVVQETVTCSPSPTPTSLPVCPAAAGAVLSTVTTGLSGPWALVVDSSGDIYTANRLFQNDNQNSITKTTPDGTTTTFVPYTGVFGVVHAYSAAINIKFAFLCMQARITFLVRWPLMPAATYTPRTNRTATS
jgi:hypothetical protein